MAIAISHGSERGVAANQWSETKGASGYVGGLKLYDTAGNTYYLWVDTNGDLRISAADTEPTAPNSDGTIVGNQS